MNEELPPEQRDEAPPADDSPIYDPEKHPHPLRAQDVPALLSKRFG